MTSFHSDPDKSRIFSCKSVEKAISPNPQAHFSSRALNLRRFQKEIFDSIQGLLYVTDRSRSSVFIENIEQGLLFSIIRAGVYVYVHKMSSSLSKSV